MDANFLTIILILAGVAIGWTLLRAMLKLTARLFAMGCIVLFIFVGGIWIITIVL